jgi:hypothetical protein
MPGTHSLAAFFDLVEEYTGSDDPGSHQQHDYGCQGVDLRAHPSRTLEKIIIGRMLDPGPDTKLALTTAMRTLSQAACRICSFCSSAPYHLVEKPAHTVTSFDALNE